MDAGQFDDERGQINLGVFDPRHERLYGGQSRWRDDAIFHEMSTERVDDLTALPD